MRRRFWSVVLVVAVLTSVLVVASPGAAVETCTIVGTEADDVLNGTAGDDVICGLGGNDTIAGHEGDDTIYGGPGDDTIGGGMGADAIYGEAGNDTVEGKTGDDIIYGGPGSDSLAGNEGDDMIYGDEGDDVLGGGKGADTIYGGAGNDTVEGKTGDDIIYGGPGSDSLAGNQGSDIIHGDEGDDVLGGGKNDDLLYGGPGADTADGKAGVDLCAAEIEANCEGDPLTVTSPASGDVVFHTETVAATIDAASGADMVELRVNGTPVIAQGIDGSEVTLAWDTTSEIDGPATLELVTLAAGQVLASDTVEVAISNGTTGSIDRLTADFEQGAISVDQYVAAGATLIFGGEVDDRYSAGANVLFGQPIDPDNPPEGTAVGMTFFRYWDDVSPEVQEAIAVDELVGPIQGEFTPSSSAPAAFAAAQAAPPPGCQDSSLAWLPRNPASFYPKAFECRTQTTHATVYWNLSDGGMIFPGTPWSDSIYQKNGLPASAVNDDSDGDGIPNFIETIGDEIRKSWDTYTKLGFQLPERVNVYVHEVGGFTDIGGDPDAFSFVPIGIQFDLKDSMSQYLPRHELFHIAQQELVDLGPFRRSSVVWWGEATAEWAVHRTTLGVPGQEPAPPYPIVGSQSEYYNELGDVLGSADAVRTSIVVEPVTWEPAFGDRSYGSFILAEHLDQHLTFDGGQANGYEAIFRTWQRIDQGRLNGVPAQSAIQGVIEEADGSPTLSSVLADFVVDNYLLDEPSGTPFGYGDVADAGSWAGELNDRRPGIAEAITLLAGESRSFSEPDLERGGAVYVEYTLAAADSGSIEITVNAEPDVEYRAMRVVDDANQGTGPALCPGAVEDTVITLVPDVASVVPIDATCNTVTVVATYADFDDADRTASWTASRSASDNLLTNPGFETGTLFGWQPYVEIPGEDALFEATTDSVHSGSYGGRIYTSDNPPMALEQQVDVTPGTQYYAATWLHSRESIADLGIRVLDAPTRAAIAEDTGTSSGTRYYDTTFMAPPSGQIIVQLIMVDRYGESPDVIFDDALLIEGAIADDIVNGDFEAFDPFGSWDRIGVESDFAGIQDPNGPPGDSAAQLTANALFLPTVLEQGPFLTTDGIQGIGLTAAGVGATITVELLSIEREVLAETSQQLTVAPSSVFVPYTRSGDPVTVRISVTGFPGTQAVIDDVYQVAE